MELQNQMKPVLLLDFLHNILQVLVSGQSQSFLEKICVMLICCPALDLVAARTS